MDIIRTICMHTAVAAFACMALPGAPAAYAAEQELTKDAARAVAGAYTIDKSHAFIQFKANHLGFSGYYGRFNGFEAQLNFDPKDPEKSTVDAVIDMGSADSGNPAIHEKYKKDFFNSVKFPTAVFKSRSVKKTGPDTGVMTGDLTLMGITKPFTLNVTFNGYGVGAYSKKETLGFSATGTLRRSDWGITAFLPAVGDEVTVLIDAEFNFAPGKPTDPSETYKE